MDLIAVQRAYYASKKETLDFLMRQSGHTFSAEDEAWIRAIIWLNLLRAEYPREWRTFERRLQNLLTV